MSSYALPDTAALRRPLEPGQYTSKEFTDLLAAHEMRQSLSRPRQCPFTG